jgi:hypothetical protein
MDDDRILEERENILNACVGFAQQMLEEHGEFYPFGVSLREDGMTMDEVYDEGDDVSEEDTPDVPEVVQRLVTAHRESAETGQLIACGTTLDVMVTDPEGNDRDAICVDVEHRGGEPIRCLLPYDIDEDGDVTYGDLVALRLEPEIFAWP